MSSRVVVGVTVACDPACAIVLLTAVPQGAQEVTFRAPRERLAVPGSHLKANSETRGIKILGITGFPDNIPPLMEAGADACLTKPLDFALVRQELERLLPSIEA